MPIGLTRKGQKMFLPATTNTAYQGSRISIGLLLVFTGLTIIPACIHLFLPDGGAIVIAGLDLGNKAPLIISLFAWAGTTQLVWGLMMLAVALRYQNLLPLMFILIFLERTLHALNMWVLKSTIDGHHPPEAYITLIMLPVLAIGYALSIWRR